jgi:hypothetical protein
MHSVESVTTAASKMPVDDLHGEAKQGGYLKGEPLSGCPDSPEATQGLARREGGGARRSWEPQRDRPTGPGRAGGQKSPNGITHAERHNGPLRQVWVIKDIRF